MRSKSFFSQSDTQITIFITRRRKISILEPGAVHLIPTQWIWLSYSCPILDTVNKFFSFIQHADRKVAVPWNSWLTSIYCWG